MSHRNFPTRNGGRHQSDPTASRYNAKYHQRGGAKNYRPESNRRLTGGDDIDSLMISIDRNFTTDEHPSHGAPRSGRTVNQTRGRRTSHPGRLPKPAQENQTGWWRISIQDAGTIGKDRVMSTLKAHCIRQFQPYHVRTVTKGLQRKLQWNRLPV